MNINVLNSLDTKSASRELFLRCFGVMVSSRKQIWFNNLLKDPIIKMLTQRLYGDYRQIENVHEFKKAYKALKEYKSTRIGRILHD